jgi:hypothetical protein
LVGNLAWQQGLLSGEDDTILHLRKLNQPFNWNEEEGEEAGNLQEGDTNSTDYIPNTCRHHMLSLLFLVCPPHIKYRHLRERV